MTEEFNFKPEDLIDKDAIARSIKQKLEEEIVNQVSWKVQDIVKDHALEILNEEIKVIIEAQKQEILQGVKDGLPGVSKALSQALVARAIQNMNGYGGREIMKKIFE